MSRFASTPFLILFGVVVLLHSKGSAATVPYQDDFDSYASGSSPSNFVTSFGGVNNFHSLWQVDNASGASGSYRNSVYGNRVQSSAVIDVTNLDRVDFTLSSTFVIQSYQVALGLDDIRVGLEALGLGPSFIGSGYQLSYEAFGAGYLSGQTGSLHIYEGDNQLNFAGGYLPVLLGNTYTMTLNGVYSVAGLILTGTLTDGSNTISATTISAAPESGTYFGYYNLAQGTSSQSAGVSVAYDNFSIISVPEPSSVVLLTVGLVFVGFYMRRRSPQGHLSQSPRLNFAVQHLLVGKEALIGCFVAMSFSRSVV